MKVVVEADLWLALRQFTRARIALGRAGESLPTKASLDFGLAHAQARDAVHLPLDLEKVAAQLSAAGFQHVAVHSAAPDRAVYLRRPDLGRRLDQQSIARLEEVKTGERPDLVLVIADGLSSSGISSHSVNLVQETVSRLSGWRLAPIVVAEQSRVALGDEIGEILEAEQVAVLIGERPGLSSPDSVGIYLTYAPRVGRSDAERNCISNIHTGGLQPAVAAQRLVYLMTRAKHLRLSGVNLKEEMAQPSQLEETARDEGS